jgi:hypothetical protein
VRALRPAKPALGVTERFDGMTSTKTQTKAKRGRPPKPEAEKMSATLRMRLDVETAERLDAFAGGAGVRNGTLIRLRACACSRGWRSREGAPRGLLGVQLKRP